MTRADIESIEKQDIRRKKLSAALVVAGEPMKLKSGHNEKERLQAEKRETAKELTR